MNTEPEVLVATDRQSVQYCISLEQRDLNVAHNIATVKGRIEAHHELRTDPIAVVCFGPSLNDTWEKIKDFKFIITCSGAHRFLLKHGIVPTWHVDVDPREHKIELLGEPHKDVEYLMASTVHPKMFEHLAGFNVKLWHVFANDEEARRVLPPGEWALFGGSSAGLRALTIARFLGFTDLQVFGMDGSFGVSGKHAAKHPNQPKKHQITEYNGVRYETTASVVECARQTFNELNQMPDVKATFHGEGLVQAMAKDYKPQPVPKGTPTVGLMKPELISKEYRELNAQLHRENAFYGTRGAKHADTVKKLIETTKPVSILDYGCGKGTLAKSLDLPIWEYDPCIPGKDTPPRPADLVLCTDVLEHIEPDNLNAVLEDLRRCVKQVGYFVIDTGPALKSYADGRNCHLIQKDAAWWGKQLAKFFTVAKCEPVKQKLHIVVGPKVLLASQPDALTITEIKNGDITCKFNTPNDTTKWRAKSLLTKEPVTANWVNSMKPGEILFDVGANVGGYTVLAGTRGVKVYAFEPEADNYALLVKNMALNGIAPNAYCVALTDHIEFGLLRLSVRGAGGSCHSFGPTNGLGMDTTPDKSQGSTGLRLDDLVAWGMPSPDHVKIDVDGFEHKVIAGARGVLSNGVRSLLVEVNTNSKDHLEMVGLLEDMGFTYDKAQVEGSIRKEGNFKGVSEYLFTKRVKSPYILIEDRFHSATVHTDPFPHMYLENVLPEYDDLVSRLPPDEFYTEISKSRAVTGYPQRFTLEHPIDSILAGCMARLRDGELLKVLCRKFGISTHGLKDECLLIRDHAGYSIGPHTDSPAKVITVLLYLPKDESLVGAGTSIYTPKEAGFTCKGGPHYPSDQFNIVKTMPFKPNSAFAFLKTDNSFHGVEPCTGTRDVLLYDIRKP